MSIESIKLYLSHKEEIFALLSQLTKAPSLNNKQFNKIVSELNDNHHIYLYIKDNKIVGIITLFIEQKLIHNGLCVAHIEDLVIDKNYAHQGIGSELIKYCLKQIDILKCYKIILDCKRELIPFYEKLGFENKNVQMSKYFYPHS
jgi:glucosamine-phosphate N-acetyltransferase